MPSVSRPSSLSGQLSAGWSVAVSQCLCVADPKSKSCNAGIRICQRETIKYFFLSEKVKVLNLIRKEKKSYAEVAITYKIKTNLLSMKLWRKVKKSVGFTVTTQTAKSVWYMLSWDGKSITSMGRREWMVNVFRSRATCRNRKRGAHSKLTTRDSLEWVTSFIHLWLQCIIEVVLCYYVIVVYLLLYLIYKLNFIIVI